MISEKDYRYIADDVYNVEKNKYKNTNFTTSKK
ncbi:hypothetical protein SAG0147_00815 [Streptococcus agalactiae MRI Z1-048]|nr:hypothetical protein SAG0053_02755 [Streptococcus agalactiae CCUG 25532]EPT86051.1 hypothetical protein SAG0099_03820 [Streptococcus agalactiae BSU247]EPV20366.1 hypothetical protein SAG0334_03000 [Streptococcus agalactiae GB00640]EPW97256.1 hypothetical protein SAG0147_00815 [Streptococcus agalactiae MRI Z1-048]CNC71319.1 Uncharacterised protein [Streptococcus agalactiae]